MTTTTITDETKKCMDRAWEQSAKGSRAPDLSVHLVMAALHEIAAFRGALTECTTKLCEALDTSLTEIRDA